MRIKGCRGRENKCKHSEIFPEMHGADPDVAEPHRIVVILKLDEDFGIVRRRILGSRMVWNSRVDAVGAANQFVVILGHHAIMKDGHNSFFDEFPFVVPVGRFKENVIGLPLPGRLAGIYQRG